MSERELPFASGLPDDEEIEQAAHACFDGPYVVGEFLHPEQRHFWKSGAKWMRRIAQALREKEQSEDSASDDCSIEERLREMADAKVLNVTLYREAAARIETLKRELTRPSGTEQAKDS